MKCPICEQEYDSEKLAFECANGDLSFIHYDMRHEHITREEAIKNFRKQVKENLKPMFKKEIL